MIIYTAIRGALRTQLLTAKKCSTGALAVVAAVSDGYTRSSGDFLADGFTIGDEIQVSGFATTGNNGRALLIAIASGKLTVDRGLTAESAGPSVTIAAGLYQQQNWESIRFTRSTGVPWFRETFRPGPVTLQSIGPKARVRRDGDYVIELFYPTNNLGMHPVESLADAILSAFECWHTVSYGGINTLIRSSQRGQGVSEPDWVRVMVTMRWTAYTINAS